MKLTLKLSILLFYVLVFPASNFARNLKTVGADLCSTTKQFATEGTRCKTDAGVEFVRVENGWKDEQGKTWYDDINIDNNDRIEFCNDRGQALPRMEDFMLAERHGIREVYKDFDGRRFATSLVLRGPRTVYFNSLGGNFGSTDDGYSMVARCVSAGLVLSPLPNVVQKWKAPDGKTWNILEDSFNNLGPVAHDYVSITLSRYQDIQKGAVAENAQEACVKLNGGHLPRKKDFERLLTFFETGKDGYLSEKGMAQLLAALPAMENNRFWSSSVHPMSSDYTYYLEVVNKPFISDQERYPSLYNRVVCIDESTTDTNP